jgi:hypothetical protein
MASENGEPRDEVEALLQSEALRAATETTDEATNESANNNNSAYAPNRSISIRINVGNRPNTYATTVRRRRPAMPENSDNNTQSSPAPVHARTIDRFPGGQSTETTRPQPPNLGSSTQHANANGALRRPDLIHIPMRGTHGRAIRVTPSGRNTQVRIVTGNGNTTAGRVQQQPQRVQLSPLVPAPLPYHASSYNSTNNESSSEQHHEDRNEFKCLICFEFLQDPASCGQCQSRFCLNCIRRVARMTGANTLAKCPTCRCEFSTSDIRRDSELRERMQRASNVKCQYQGCSAQLSLNQVKSHEESCLFVPLKCRYATFGCDWKGTRQLLADHESTCPLMQVSALVEQFRQTRADHEHAINLLQTRVAASNAMMELHASLIRRLQKRSYHPGDMMDLVYTVTCTPARFISTKDVWRPLTGCRLSRGFLCNVLMFLPLALVVIRVDLAGSRHFLQLYQSESILVEKNIDALVDLSLVVIIVLVWIAMLTVFIKIGKNSVEWQPTGQSEKLLVKCAAALSFSIQLAALEYDSQILSWIAVCVCSTFFPTFVITLIETVNGNNRGPAGPTDLWTAGRAVPIILFGLRYSLVAHVTDVVVCLDVAVYHTLLQRYSVTLLNQNFVVKDDCFLNDMPKKYLLGYAFGTLAMTTSTWWFTGTVPTWHYKSPLAFVLLAVVNYMINHLIALGGMIAALVFEEAKAEVLPNQSGVRKVCNLTGCILFTSWALLLVGILVSS